MQNKFTPSVILISLKIYKKAGLKTYLTTFYGVHFQKINSILQVVYSFSKNPALINAPMQGIIKSFAVSPGTHVQKGQLLLILDDTELQSNIKVNQRDYSLTETKLRTAINEAFNDESRRIEVPVLQAQL